MFDTQLPTQGGSFVHYVVQPGDSLSRIAKRYGIAWKDLALANGVEKPDLIHPGDVFLIP